MSTAEQTAAAVENSKGDGTNEVHDNGIEKVSYETPSKIAKVDESGDKSVKRRSSGRKKNRDEEMMAEARAVCGEIDTSAGRSMRKRPDPPKVEEKKKQPVQRRGSKKGGEKAEVKSKAVAEDEEEDSNTGDQNDDNKSEDKKSSTVAAKDTVNKTNDTAAVASSDETAAAASDSKAATSNDTPAADEPVANKNGTSEETKAEAANGTDGAATEDKPATE